MNRRMLQRELIKIIIKSYINKQISCWQVLMLAQLIIQMIKVSFLRGRLFNRFSHQVTGKLKVNILLFLIAQHRNK